MGQRMMTVNVGKSAFPSEKAASVSLLGRPAMAEPVRYPITIYSIETGPLPGGKRLIHPIIVWVEHDEGEVVVSEPHFHMHASAPTEVEAIAVFRRILSGYLDSLARREKTLGPPLRDQLNYLRSVIASE
jgi:hypothetical protein